MEKGIETINTSIIEITENITCKGSGEKMASRVTKIERIVKVDGEEWYREAVIPRIKSGSGMDDFMRWLFGQEKRTNSSNVSKYGGKKLSFFRKVFLKSLYFKAQFIKRL